ncbi:amino acid permease [Hirsutella rhossiliensis]|uniref:Amino acid permease domain-containing protein n=1 Tax=Hirsutella rhossiliensis TaxID=111463 RepID=A0A9P8NAY9_9HYPO|nr:amino acid permease domain-containing protein [Hirsutella rhossiliensis]KAH0967827.1 amino acid permease domain-containing protein [Hirsutella rhossiliensis]
MFLIFNKVIGTGIFSTPSVVFASAGSVGVSLILWLVGAIIAFCGLSVFLEFGLAIPRSGGTKNYVERVYRRPRYLASCLVAAHVIFLGFSSVNALSFSRYVLRASSGRESDGWQVRAIAVAVVTFAVVVHSVLPKWGIRLFTVLGVVKVAILVFIVFSGFAALAGHRRVPDPHNFDDSFESESGGGAYAFSKALLSVIYSYGGWESSTYVMGELRRPGKTLAVAAPLAIGSVATLYMLANVAYFAAIPKAQLAKSEVLVADVFFRNMFGDSAASRVLPIFVALSNLGGILAASFVNSRLIQELAKEGLLPFSRFWASTRPFNSPAASLFLHWIVTTIVLFAPPGGPAYTLLVNVSAYANAWVNASVAAGLLWLQHKKSEQWSSPWHTYLPVSLAFLSVNLFLIVAPFIPPREVRKPGEYPYYVFPIVGIATFFLAIIYWVLWRKLIPYCSGHRLVSERTFENQVETVRYRKLAVTHRWPRRGLGT